MNNSNFNNNTANKLSGLFANLPEVFFWTVIVTRLFIALPLFLAAQKHFAFLGNGFLVNATSLASVLIIEAILTLPSLSTAFFRAGGMKNYERTAFWTTIVLGGFNMLLIYWAWIETQMHREAFIMYTVLNLASIVLAEFIGYMVSLPQNAEKPSDLPAPAQAEPAPEPELSETIKAILADHDLTRDDKILSLNNEGVTGKQIAILLKCDPSTVSRVIKRA